MYLSVLFAGCDAARRAFARTAVLAFALSITAASTAKAQKADPEIYGALPTISDAAMSPDGETIAMLQYAGGMSTLAFFDYAKEDAQPEGLPLGDFKPRGIEWVNDDYLLLLMSIADKVAVNTGVKEFEFFRWIAVNRRDKSAKMLFQRDAGFVIESSGNLISTKPSKRDEAIIARWTGQAGAGSGTPTASRFGARKDTSGYSLITVNLKNGRDRVQTPGEPTTYDWVVDEEGQPLMRADWDAANARLKVFSTGGEGKRLRLVREIEAQQGDPAPYLLYGRLDGAAADANEIAASSRAEGPRDVLVGIDIKTGKVTRTIASDPDFDLSGYAYDARTARVKAAFFGPNVDRVVYFDEGLQAVHDQLNGALKSSAVTLSSMSADRQKILAYATQPDFPPDYYVFDRDRKKLDYFSSTRPAMGAADVIDRRRFDYTSPDGLKIEGYYTTPQGAQGKKLPLIVLPHGGPAGRDTLAYDWWAAFYAARGYGVYQPNFRGSSGYGAAFEQAGHGEWGRKMQDDLTNGVAPLVEAGKADPARVCIVGASYGGYAALAGATLTPDVYKCAVSVNGVSDLPALIGYAKSRSGDFGADYWEKRIGSRFRDEKELNAVSPRRNARRAGAPVLLIHGTDDIVVPLAQSKWMAEALADAGKAYEYVELDGEDHWLSGAETRTEMLRRSIDFIDRHIGR